MFRFFANPLIARVRSGASFQQQFVVQSFVAVVWEIVRVLLVCLVSFSPQAINTTTDRGLASKTLLFVLLYSRIPARTFTCPM